MKKLYFLLAIALMMSIHSRAQVLLMKDTTIKTCNGVFYDSGGNASSYGSGENKTMTIVSDNGNRLNFNFQTFATESCCDYLDIFDGPSNLYPLIGRYLGTNSPGIINSTDTAITFVFHSDASGTNLGWAANISCTTPPLTPYLLTSGTINTCSGIFYDGNGPAANYSNNTDDAVTFCTASLQTLTFTFINFNLSSDDTLFAFDGSSLSSPLIGVYTGTMLPEVIYAKSGGCVTFRFKSNGVNVSSGWKAIIACSPTMPAQVFNMSNGVRYTCNGTFNDDGGNTGSYTSSQSRTMTFFSDNGNRLNFNFQSFATEACCDYLDIYDGPTTASPYIGRFLGTGSPGNVLSTHNSLTFYFQSDGSGTNMGWSANISCSTPSLTAYNMTSGTVTTCNGAFYDNGGLSSNYPNNENRTMTFCGDSAQYLVFNFSNFNIDGQDSLFAFDGADANAPLIGIYTGTVLPEAVYSKSGHCVTFKFISNSTVNASGWKALMSCSGTIPTENFLMTNGVRYTCGGTFYDNGGSAGSYTSSQAKTMTFYSENGNRLKFNFQSFATESCCDYLDIFDGPSSASPYLGRFLGTSSPGNILSAHNSLTFYFQSDASNTNMGWAASISCVTPSLTAYNMESGIITTCEGVFYDHGGMNANYSNSERRVMSFCSDNNQYSIIRFSHLNLELNDTLFAYDGIDTTAAPIGIYTGTQVPETIYSKSGHCITFRFVSNSSISTSGWKAFVSCDTVPPVQNINMGYGVHYVCEANFYDDGGALSSYTGSQNKVMTLVSDNGNRLAVNFQTFATESCCDYLDIYDGPSVSYPYLGRMIGTPAMQNFISSGTALTFKFVSDGSNSNLGWSASVNCTTPVIPAFPMTSGTINTCNAVFYDNGGGGASYPNNENRVMTFCSDTSTFIKIHFSPYNFNVSSGDSLFVYDGSNVSSTLIAVLSGNSSPEDISSTAGSCLTFKFISNATTNTNGWQGFLSCSAIPPNSPAIFNMSNGVRYTCNARFYDSGGSTGNYVSSENKIQSFCSNSGCPISAIFSSFTSEGSVDALTIYDGMSTTAPLLGTYGGSTSPGTKTSTGNCLTFKFVSDGSNTYAGWSALLACDTASIAVSPANHSCVGDSIALTANTGIAYLWSNGATTQTIQAKSSGIYSVTVTSASGCNLVSAPSAITFYALPSATITTSGTTTFCVGFNVVLTAAVGNTYHWSSGSISQAITVAQSGNYWATVTNSNGCKKISDTISVIVNPLPIATISHSGSTNLCEGDSLLLQGSIGNGYTYQWKKDNVVIQNATSATYTVSQVGSYTVEIANTCGNVQSSATTISITLNPTATITPNGQTTFCEGNHVLLNAAIGSGYSYIWLKDEAIITNVITSNYAAYNGGDYAVIITNSCGSDTSVKTAITVNNIPVANAGTDISIANGTSTILAGSASGGSGNYSYFWSPASLLLNQNEQTPTTANLSSSTTYTLTVTDNTTGCTGTDQIIVTVSCCILSATSSASPNTVCNGNQTQLSVFGNGGTGSYTYSWASTPVGFSSILSNPTASPTLTTTYTVSVNDGYNTATSAIVVNVHSYPLINPLNDVSVCNGSNITLISSGGDSYQWNTGQTQVSIVVAPIITTTYTVTISTVYGCSTTDNVVVTVLASPNAMAGTDMAICAGDSVQLNATGGTTYSWSPTTGLSDGSIPNPIAYPTATTSYTVAVMNVFSCTASDQVVITINVTPPIPIITANGNDLHSSSPANNQWYLNGTQISGATDQLYTIAQSGDYSVIVTNSNGCSTPSSVFYALFTGIQNVSESNAIAIFPNPTNDKIMIKYSLSNNNVVKMELLNILGESITTVVNENQSKGDYTININLKQLDVENGVYNIRLKTNNDVYFGKVIYVR